MAIKKRPTSIDVAPKGNRMNRRTSRLVIGAGIVAATAGIVALSWRIGAVSPFIDRPAPNTNKPTAAPTQKPGQPWFVNVAAERKIDFRHFDPATPQHYIQETMGSGLGWIDYDNDGWLDLICVQDGPLHPVEGAKSGPTNKLYRNRGDGSFSDVTEATGLARRGFGQGCAVGDFDNDGFDDLVVTYWRGIVLYHNEAKDAGRRFVDVTAQAGLANPHWATSCAWGDVDGDGFLDLYVCNYCEVNLDKYVDCEFGLDRLPGSCPPWAFPSTSHRLFRNNGNGTFTDISKSAGIAGASPAPGLGVIMTDLDGDGRIDIFVANDMRPAYLFHNQGGGRFVERALASGCGLDANGRSVAGMGIEAGDVDGSGRPSLFVTNFHNVPNILYRNMGKLLFHDWSIRSNLAAPSIDRLGFGTVFCDADLDGRLDIAVANGHVSRTAPQAFRADYEQQAQLFLGIGPARFRDISGESGDYFLEKRVGRGLAWADFDNDGRPDLAFSHVGEATALLHNRTETANHWIRLELVGDGKKSNRNAIGARIEIATELGKQTRFIHGGGSYLSASDRRQLVGLGKADEVKRVSVRWPSGRAQEFRELKADHAWRLIEGDDTPKRMSP